MKMKNYFRTFILLMLLGIVIYGESCAVRDCKGRRKTAKTNMGGWL
jgi:hypothetical protein